MAKYLYNDLETYSDTPLSHGTHAYAEKAEVLLWAYALDDGTPQVWDVASGEPMPMELEMALGDPEIIKVWHNGAMFDLVVLMHAMPHLNLPIEEVEDTMVLAYMHGLPGSLDGLGKLYRAPEDKKKDKDGGRLIRLFCLPLPRNMKIRRATSDTHPEEWEKFKAYAARDIEAMRHVHQHLPRWNCTGEERAIFELDQRINRRGIRVDVALARAAMEAVGIAQDNVRDRTSILTDNALGGLTQRDKILQYILSTYGIELPDLKVSTVERQLNDQDIPEVLRELLMLRVQAGSASTRKYKALMDALSSDGRIRGLLQYCGAQRTMRWAGRTFQPQNLPSRGVLDKKEIPAAIDALMARCADLLYADLIKVASSVIRSCLVPSEGKRLHVSDLSNIEGRLVAWFAGEEWKLDAFRAFDLGVGHDLYVLAYAKAFNVDPDAVVANTKAGGNWRQIGKTMELACLGGDTKVLTNLGIIPILEVTSKHKVWDGTSWVNHGGVIARGVKQTVNVGGMHVTPDHLILTGETWSQAQELVSSKSTMSLALETASVNLPYGVMFTDPLEVSSSSSSNVVAARLRTTCIVTTSIKDAVRDAMLALRKHLLFGVRTFGVTPTLSQMTRTADGYSTAYQLASTDAGTRATLGIKTTAGEVYMSGRSGEKIGELSPRILSRWKDGIHQSLSSTVSTLIKDTSRVIFGSYPDKSTSQIGVKSKLCKKELSSSRPVFDIVNAGPLNRFTVITDAGPLVVHNCGYGGGVGAFVTFALAFRLDLDELADNAIETIDKAVWHDTVGAWRRAEKDGRTYGLSEKAWRVCESFKVLWRKAHPNVERLWYELEDAFKAAMQNKTEVFKVGKHLSVSAKRGWIRVHLPSGTAISYASCKIKTLQRSAVCAAFNQNGITYYGQNSKNKKWGRVLTYSGKLFENVCQKAARDIMAHNMLNAEAQGYDLLLTVHDELVAEADATSPPKKELSAILATNPPWSTDLPLAASGHVADRYGK